MIWLAVAAVLAVPLVWAGLHLLAHYEHVVLDLAPERQIVARVGPYDWEREGLE